MPEYCRVTVTFVAEFESDDPDVDLAQLREEAEFEPRDFIATAFFRDCYTECNVHIERDL